MMENTPASDFPLFALTGTLRIGSIQRNLYGFSREMSGQVAIRRKLSCWHEESLAGEYLGLYQTAESKASSHQTS